MNRWRWTVFLTLVLTVWALIHGYVFWRLATIPWVAAHCSTGALWAAAAALWLSYPAARMLNSFHLGPVGAALEFAAAAWLGTLFLLFASLVTVDVLTAGGWLFPRVADHLRGAGVLAALLLSVLALVQGIRSPVVVDYEVEMAGLPPEREGFMLVVVSDLHLGTLKGHRWLRRLIIHVRSLKPDLVAVVGDLVDGDVRHVETLVPLLKELRAPLGVWAVTGNHEYYAGLEPSVALLEAAGYSVLRDRWVEVAPGLVLAGVDDLTAREQFGQRDYPIAKALLNRPPGATILLSHSPMHVDLAAQAGVGLMLSGHTHAGQLWPFSYLVKLRYPLLAGRYAVGYLSMIVCRGTGTWGPPMRLWRPSEILRITLTPKGTAKFAKGV